MQAYYLFLGSLLQTGTGTCPRKEDSPLGRGDRHNIFNCWTSMLLLWTFGSFWFYYKTPCPKTFSLNLISSNLVSHAVFFFQKEGRAGMLFSV